MRGALLIFAACLTAGGLFAADADAVVRSREKLLMSALESAPAPRARLLLDAISESNSARAIALDELSSALAEADSAALQGEAARRMTAASKLVPGDTMLAHLAAVRLGGAAFLSAPEAAAWLAAVLDNISPATSPLHRAELIDSWLVDVSYRHGFASGDAYWQKNAATTPEEIRSRIKFYRAAAKADPEKYRAAYDAALDEFAGLEDMDAAERAAFLLDMGEFERVITLAGNSRGPIEQLSRLARIELLKRKGKFEEALKLCDQAEGGDAIALRRIRGELLVRLNRLDEAEKNSKNAIDLLQLHIFMRDYKKVQSDCKALAAMMQAAKRPVPAAMRIIEADAAVKLGQLDELEKILTEAEKEDSPDLLNGVAYSAADANIELERAEKMIVRALAAAPRNYAFLDSLAWVRFRRGDLAGAREAMRQTIAAQTAEGGSDGVLFDHAGDIESAAGDHAAAAEFYRKALQSGGRDLDADAVRSKLDKLN
ncbi:MAG: hypothetical protein PHI35_02930 [Victivallaceae bacterium]|nr:hypothetical protein [Victivallaceae bacterium]